MKITAIHSAVVPIASEIRNAYIDFSKMTLSLVAVFVPILFMGGMMGRLFREFAVTLSVAILVSLVVCVVSLLLVLALSRYREVAADRGAAMSTGGASALANCCQ